MSDYPPFLILDQTCDAAIAWVTGQLTNAGMQVVCTFDLHVARHDQATCPCPHHGTQQCDCQMVVLLVYNAKGQKIPDRQPVSLVSHGYNNQTWFSVVDTPQQRADPGLEAAIRMALVPHISATLVSQASQPNAA